MKTIYEVVFDVLLNLKWFTNYGRCVNKSKSRLVVITVHIQFLSERFQSSSKISWWLYEGHSLKAFTRTLKTTLLYFSFRGKVFWKKISIFIALGEFCRCLLVRCRHRRKAALRMMRWLLLDHWPHWLQCRAVLFVTAYRLSNAPHQFEFVAPLWPNSLRYKHNTETRGRRRPIGVNPITTPCRRSSCTSRGTPASAWRILWLWNASGRAFSMIQLKPYTWVTARYSFNYSLLLA